MLRPEQTRYPEAVLADANEATRLINTLEAQSATLGAPFTLIKTRTMIEAYRFLLNEVQTLSAQGEMPNVIDEAVQFDDYNAIREIDTLLDGLSEAVVLQVEKVEDDAELLSVIRFRIIFLVIAFIAALLLNQYHVRRHVQSVRLMNQRLESSNNHVGTANTALQQFAGMVSHDMSTPLRHIGFYSELVEENCAEPATVREHVSVIKNAVVRMDALISSLLDFTRTGFVKPALVPVDVSAFINGVVQELRSTIESRGATVNLQLSGCVLADPELLRRILYNLIDNILKYVPTDRPPHINV